MKELINDYLHPTKVKLEHYVIDATIIISVVFAYNFLTH